MDNINGRLPFLGSYTEGRVYNLEMGYNEVQSYTRINIYALSKNKTVYKI